MSPHFKLGHVLAGFCHAMRSLPPASADDGVTNETILQEIKRMSDTFDAELTQLRADVAAQSTVIASATAAFTGLAAQLSAAEASAKSAGATDAQIFGVSAVRQTLEANTAALAAAIPANTPAATAAQPAPEQPAPTPPADTTAQPVPSAAPAAPETTAQA